MMHLYFRSHHGFSILGIFCSLFCYANESMSLLKVLICPDRMGQDKMAELKIQIAKLILRDSRHSQVLTLSGKCQNCRKHNLDYVMSQMSFLKGKMI